MGIVVDAVAPEQDVVTPVSAAVAVTPEEYVVLSPKIHGYAR